ncbi:aminotransferase class IV family protein [Nocardia sp. NPDC058499]|uniref:aminotransferase class IV family protein n=1 Tax=Nocardia sp. NPDC058499 TaxID=3346530 RepID=UPI003648E1C3
MELNGVPVTLADLAPLGLVNFGHFTSMRVEDRAVRGLTLHLDRLTRDCRAVFDTDLDAERVRELVRHALRDTERPAVVRVSVYDPAIQMGRPGAAAEPHILVTMRAASSTPPPPLRLQSAVYARDLPKVKHLGLFGAMHHRASAQRAGYDDVVFSEPDGTITEIATSNIGFITTAGQLVWPHADVLVGTTMRLINQARDEDVVTDRITLSQLDRFTGVVATNAAVGVRPVSGLDNHRWPAEHELIDTLRKEYESIPPQRL